MRKRARRGAAWRERKRRKKLAQIYECFLARCWQIRYVSSLLKNCSALYAFLLTLLLPFRSRERRTRSERKFPFAASREWLRRAEIFKTLYLYIGNCSAKLWTKNISDRIFRGLYFPAWFMSIGGKQDLPLTGAGQHSTWRRARTLFTQLSNSCINYSNYDVRTIQLPNISSTSFANFYYKFATPVDSGS